VASFSKICEKYSMPQWFRALKSQP